MCPSDTAGLARPGARARSWIDMPPWNERSQPLAEPCPECMAKPLKRCRITGVTGTVQLLSRPHPARVALAWRKYISSQARP